MTATVGVNLVWEIGMGSPICFTPAPKSQVSDSIEVSGLPLLETVFDELLVRVEQH